MAKTKTRLILKDTISLHTYLFIKWKQNEGNSKITMKDERIDMKVEKNEMKSAHFEIGRILICRPYVISYHISNPP